MAKKITLKEGDTVTCPFCKQSRILTHSVTIEYSAQEYENLGALECGCADARIFQNKKKSKDNVPYLLNSYIEFCQRERGSDAAEAAESSKSCIQNACFAIIEGMADKIVLNVKGVKIKLSLNKGKQLEMKCESKKEFAATTNN